MENPSTSKSLDTRSGDLLVQKTSLKCSFAQSRDSMTGQNTASSLFPVEPRPDCPLGQVSTERHGDESRSRFPSLRFGLLTRSIVPPGEHNGVIGCKSFSKSSGF